MSILRLLVPFTLLATALAPGSPAAEAPRRAPVHRTQALRQGQVRPRDRAATQARSAPAGSAEAPAQARRVRPYQAPRPGEGARKD